MLRALWFMLKIGLLLAIALWIAEQPGSIRIAWQDYKIDAHLGFSLALLFGALLVTLLIYRLALRIADFPALIFRRRAASRKERGYRALTLGMSAVAAGDTRTASRQALKARKLLQDDTGLPRLLEAQAARLEGREEEAKAHFAQILNNADAAFLGVRGLLQNALEKSDKGQALQFARKALEKHPRQGWILKIAYDLEIQSRHFDEARKILKRAESAGSINPAKARSDRIAIALHEGDELRKTGFLPQTESRYKEAWSLDKFYAPGAERLASFYLQNGKRKKAIAVLEKIWKQNPHPELVRLWMMARPSDMPEHHIKALSWLKRLITINGESGEALRAYAELSMRHELWAEARSHLLKAIQIDPVAKTYKMLATLEFRAGDHPELASSYLEQATEAMPEKTWVCTQSGMTYRNWEAFAKPHDAFNSMVWGEPLAIFEQRGHEISPKPYRILEAV